MIRNLPPFIETIQSPTDQSIHFHLDHVSGNFCHGELQVLCQMINVGKFLILQDLPYATLNAVQLWLRFFHGGDILQARSPYGFQ